MQTHTWRRHYVPRLPDACRNLAVADAVQARKPEMATFIRDRTFRAMRAIREARQARQGDVWHALLEQATGRKIKFAAMAEAEAERRKPTISDLGLVWVRCGPTD